ncbi:hypothetical protein [Carbonactinospora thermoautotrophica]|uniref:hypothetical protein n=2 Tax=Carbonactinospora thermoautotrophica TaxID=1469144 RepID=UPI003DA85E20
MRMRLLMCDHPSWQRAEDGTAYRVVRVEGAVWLVAWRSGEQPRMTLLEGSDDFGPRVDVVAAPAHGHHLPASLWSALVGLGPVGRMRNPDLWDAFATSIIRQVIRAGHARGLYRRFCQEYGKLVDTPHGSAWLFPRPEVVSELGDDAFAATGLRFHASALRAAALAYAERGEKWVELAPRDLFEELQTVTRVGPWSAGATVADFLHDWSLYPYADRAVRTWATRAASGVRWPESEPEFARAWRAATGDHLSTLTLLTLAWGAIHGDTS